MNGRTGKEFLLKIVERKRSFYYEGISEITFVGLLLRINPITNLEGTFNLFLVFDELPESRELYKTFIRFVGY